MIRGGLDTGWKACTTKPIEVYTQPYSTTEDRQIFETVRWLDNLLKIPKE